MDYGLLKECREKIKMGTETEQRIIENCEKAEKGSRFSKKLILKKICRAAVAACIIFMTGLPTVARHIPRFYRILYNFIPETADRFSLVELSCEDNGIKMEVIASHIHNDTAQIYISITDIEGGRIDETVDLFDSYDIATVYDTSAHCEKVSFDADTATATFLITIIQDNNKKLNNERITFTVRQLLCGKQQYDGEIENYKMGELTDYPRTQIMDIRGWGATNKLLFEKYSRVDTAQMLVPQGNLAQPTDGVTLTAVGYIGDELRVQVKYDDIGQTDNHGYIYLKDKERGQIIKADGSISAFAEDNSSSYEEYIFTGIAPENTDLYSLYGYFVTSDTLIKGNWQVKFKAG